MKTPEKQFDSQGKIKNWSMIWEEARDLEAPSSLLVVWMECRRLISETTITRSPMPIRTSLSIPD